MSYVLCLPGASLWAVCAQRAREERKSVRPCEACTDWPGSRSREAARGGRETTDETREAAIPNSIWLWVVRLYRYRVY